MYRKALGLLAVVVLGGCTTVPPGYVGIKVNSWGNQRGVADFPLSTGVVAYNPFTTSVLEFPTFVQREVWTKSPQEGSATDESITCRSSKGMSVGFDVAVAYRFVADKVPHVYVKYKRPAELLTTTIVRDQVRSALCNQVEHYEIMDILGDKLTTVTTETTKQVNGAMLEDGIAFEYVNVIGKPHVDPSVESAINNVIAASQQAAAAQQKVKQSEYEAQQAVKTAEGRRNAAIVEAEGTKEANRIINESLNDKLLEYQRINRWNGVLPQVTSGGNPFITLKDPK